ncbi:tRNA-dihydrouridine synthase [Nitrospira sp.]|nr:tRNA-dihydrouridine synthase [Nitrospira sp.]
MSFWTRTPHPIFGLAPMDGVTDAPFRRLVARYGKPDVTFTEFTHVHDVCRAPDYVLDSLQYSEAERPVVAQIYGKDPELFYVAAQVIGELGFDGLDINMGCPSKSVSHSGSGAGLIRTPELARRIVEAARRGLDDWAAGAKLSGDRLRSGRLELIQQMNEVRGLAAPAQRRILPLSIKTRLGYDLNVIERWMTWLLESRPAAITIHGRTLEQMYRGRADWSAIARAARCASGTGTLVLGNGDIRSLAEAASRIDETGVDGVLVGRGVLGEPWFFREAALARGRWEFERKPIATEWNPAVAPSVRLRAMLDHARLFETLCGRKRFPHVRKHLAWYCKGFRHAAELRARMVRASGVSDVEAILHEFGVAHGEYKAIPSSGFTPTPPVDRFSPQIGLSS